MPKSSAVSSSATGFSSKHFRKTSSKIHSVTSIGQPFHDDFYAACKELEMKIYPVIKSMSSEPQPWLNHATDELVARFSNLASRSTTTNKKSQKVGTESVVVIKDEEDVYPLVRQVYSPEQEIKLIFSVQRLCLTLLICKGFPMTDHILGAIQRTLPKYQSLTNLQLEFCNLTLEQLKAVKFLLQENPNIIDVSLNGNPIPKQPYHILIKNTMVAHLSLKFCEITENGAKKLKGPLSLVAPQCLITLNLSSNWIKDAGAQQLADALRTNRTLTHLTLSDNGITNVGAIALFSICVKFALNHEEVVKRREKNFYCALLREEMYYDLTKTRKTSSKASLSSNKSDTSSKRSCSSAKARLTKAWEKKSASSGSLSRRSSADARKGIDEIIEARMPKDPYPFMKDCVAENKEVYHRGNYHLQFINLSYNKVGEDALVFLGDALKEQQLNYRIEEEETGLVKVILEGNYIKNLDSLIERSPVILDESKRSSKTSVKSRRSFINKIVL